MPFIDNHLLSLILFTPAAAAVLLLFLPARSPRVDSLDGALGQLYPACGFPVRLAAIRRRDCRAFSLRSCTIGTPPSVRASTWAWTASP